MAILLVLLVLQYPIAEAATTEWSEEIQQKSTTDSNKPWTITFSQNIDEKTVSDENVKVTDAKGNAVLTAWKVKDNKITVTPKSSYDAGTYYLYVGPNIQSVNNKQQKANIKFTFVVKDNVSPFTVDVHLVEERYGYAELALQNIESDRVMYELVERNTNHELVEVGEEVPVTTVEYKAGDQFLYYMDHQVHVYLVDAHNRVVSSKKVSKTIYPVYEFDKSQVKVKTTFKPWTDIDAEKNPSLYIITEDSVEYFTDMTQEKWHDDNGVQTITYQMKKPIEGAYISGIYFPSKSYTLVGGEPHTDKVLLNHLYFALKLPAEDRIRDSVVDWSLWQITCGEYLEYNTDERCEDPGAKLFEEDSVSLEAYKQEFLANKDTITTKDQAKQLIESVNARLKDQIDNYKLVDKLIDMLYRDNAYDYPPDERIREGVTKEDIAVARAAVESLSDAFEEKQNMIDRIAVIEYLFEADFSE